MKVSSLSDLFNKVMCKHYKWDLTTYEYSSKHICFESDNASAEESGSNSYISRTNKFGFDPNSNNMRIWNSIWIQNF